ncbi:MAG: hypothetical protein K0U74_16975 [Alphaproteobacteria bacterium]|nr:hypothetical protein [Alphaproteobacteria bacterium]
MRTILIASLCLLHITSLNAQTVSAKVERAKRLLVPVGELYRVDEGVFDLKFGQSIDLTNRRLLMRLDYDKRRKWLLTINGMVPHGSEVVGSTYWRTGSRINLKLMESTESFVLDKDVCTLDVVDIATPKGAPATGTFRLFCD